MTISKCQQDMQIKLEICEFITDEADVSPKVASDHHMHPPQRKRACSRDDQKRARERLPRSGELNSFIFCCKNPKNSLTYKSFWRLKT